MIGSVAPLALAGYSQGMPSPLCVYMMSAPLCRSRRRLMTGLQHCARHSSKWVKQAGSGACGGGGADGGGYGRGVVYSTTLRQAETCHLLQQLITSFRSGTLISAVACCTLFGNLQCSCLHTVVLSCMHATSLRMPCGRVASLDMLPTEPGWSCAEQSRAVQHGRLLAVTCLAATTKQLSPHIFLGLCVTQGTPPLLCCAVPCVLLAYVCRCLSPW